MIQTRNLNGYCGAPDVKSNIGSPYAKVAGEAEVGVGDLIGMILVIRDVVSNK